MRDRARIGKMPMPREVYMRMGFVAALVLGMAASSAVGEVTRIEITSRTKHADGKKQGDRGPYECVKGKAYFSLEPALAGNKEIVDLSLAPLNKEGKVEFWADVEIWAPADLAKSNGALFYEVNNRGWRGLPGLIQGGADDFLLRQGFIVIKSGWIAEILPDEKQLRMAAPVARGKDGPITGRVRGEVILGTPATKTSLTPRGIMGSYRPTDRGQKEATMTMREHAADPRITIPREQWSFVVTEVTHEGRPWTQPLVELQVPAGFKPGWMYEVIYEAQDPVVQGVGFAGIRDLISFLRYEASAGNPLAGKDSSHKPVASRAIAFGVSQSGRCLRQFLAEGFNADEKGRMVFDGLIPHVAGGGLGSFNHRFASPTRTSTQHEGYLFPTDVFPFAYGDSTDPFTGETDGILRKARATKTAPKLFHTQSSSEYWHRAGSLVHTTADGKKDAEIPPEVRIYTFGGTNHGSGSGVPAPAKGGTLPVSPADYRPFMRGLVMALDAWIKGGEEPPSSVFPTIADGTLVEWKKDATNWPMIPGVAYPTAIHSPAAANRGPEWKTQRIGTIEPPEILGRYVVRVPACDRDGNERGTLQVPAVAVPLATYTGWNIRNGDHGAAGDLASLTGGYIPFRRTVAERLSAGDPRPAVLQRYRDFADYQKQYMDAATELVKRRYLLEEDLPRLKALCEKSVEVFEAK